MIDRVRELQGVQSILKSPWAYMKGGGQEGSGIKEGKKVDSMIDDRR